MVVHAPRGTEAAPPRTPGGVAVPELQETLLGQAFEHAPVGVIVLDESGSYLAANRRAAAITGHSREELLALGAHGLVVSPAADTVLDAMAAGSLTNGFVTVRCKDGSEKTVAFRVGETVVSGLPFFVTVFWEGCD